MGEMIHKPDANPALFAAANLFLGCGGYFWMGQSKKGILSLVLTFVTSCCGLSLIWVLVAAYDAFLLGQKLEQGESIGANENGLDFLNAIFKD